MSLFSDLQEESQKQKETVAKQQAGVPGKPTKKQSSTGSGKSRPTTKVAQNNAQKVEQAYEQLSKGLSREVIEVLAFGLRDKRKSKVNTEIPTEWKVEFDDLAHRLKVGKYDLLMFIVGEFFGKVKRRSVKP